MRLSIKALGIAGALLWGGAILMCGIASLVTGSYGAEFLKGGQFHLSRVPCVALGRRRFGRYLLRTG